MHSARVPLDFDFDPAEHGLHIASGETAMFWFGLLLFVGALYGLWRGLMRREFGHYQRTLPRTDGKQSAMYWIIAVVHIGLLFAGIDLVVAGLYGIKPVLFG